MKCTMADLQPPAKQESTWAWIEFVVVDVSRFAMCKTRATRVETGPFLPHLKSDAACASDIRPIRGIQYVI